MIYFISGHRNITEEKFLEVYVPAIDKVIDSDSQFGFVIGDYYGVDIMAQEYIVKRGFADKVFVYHMFDKPRNLAEGITHTIGGFQSDEERDAAMTRDSDFDIAFYDHEPSGTSENIRRRHCMNYKPVEIK